MLIEKFQGDGLTILVTANHLAGSYVVLWEGAAKARDPEGSFAPFLRNLAERTRPHATMELDFRNLSYVNSAAFSSIVQLLRALDSKAVSTSLLFNHAVPWQRISATCIRVLSTRMKHIYIL